MGGPESARTGALASGITWSVAVSVLLSEHAVPCRREDEAGPRDDRQAVVIGSPQAAYCTVGRSES